jgi:hypothetical protein
MWDMFLYNAEYGTAFSIYFHKLYKKIRSWCMKWSMELDQKYTYIFLY